MPVTHSAFHLWVSLYKTLHQRMNLETESSQSDPLKNVVENIQYLHCAKLMTNTLRIFLRPILVLFVFSRPNWFQLHSLCRDSEEGKKCLSAGNKASWGLQTRGPHRRPDRQQRTSERQLTNPTHHAPPAAGLVGSSGARHDFASGRSGSSGGVTGFCSNR